MNDILKYDIGYVLSNNLIRTTTYHDGIMNVFEHKSICTTPVKEKDILIEYIFEFKSL